jgi:hypothetical protein
MHRLYVLWNLNSPTNLILDGETIDLLNISFSGFGFYPEEFWQFFAGMPQSQAGPGSLQYSA